MEFDQLGKEFYSGLERFRNGRSRSEFNGLIRSLLATYGDIPDKDAKAKLFTAISAGYGAGKPHFSALPPETIVFNRKRPRHRTIRKKRS